MRYAHDFEFNETSHTPEDSGVFGIILPTLDDLYLLNPLACMLYNTGHIVPTFIHNEVSTSNGMRGYDDDRLRNIALYTTRSTLVPLSISLGLLVVIF